MARSWSAQDDYVFDRYVTVQYRTDGDSATNFPVDDWDVTRSRSIPMARQARVYGQGGEMHDARQVNVSDETRWVMRYRTDMDPDLVDVARNRRLVYQSRVMDILAAEQVGRKAFIELRTIANPSGETA